MKEIDKTIHLTCDCGAHILQVNCHLDFYDDGKRYFQEWNFAAFDYAGLGKPTLWHRIRVAWRYLRKGEMHKDQVILNEEEAKRLGEFIEQNNFAKCAEGNVL
jgi:hypothetical protein